MIKLPPMRNPDPCGPAVLQRQSLRTRELVWDDIGPLHSSNVLCAGALFYHVAWSFTSRKTPRSVRPLHVTVVTASSLTCGFCFMAFRLLVVLSTPQFSHCCKRTLNAFVWSRGPLPSLPSLPVGTARSHLPQHALCTRTVFPNRRSTRVNSVYVIHTSL